MNYFRLLKLKEEELELLQKELEKVTLEYKESLKLKLDLIDLYNKEIDNLENLNQYELEDNQKDFIKGIIMFWVILSMGISFLVFQVFSQVLWPTLLGIILFNGIEISVNIRLIKYLTNNFQIKRNEKEEEIREQEKVIRKVEYKKKEAFQKYQLFLEKKVNLSKEVNIKTVEVDYLKKEIWQAFYPFLINLDEQKLTNDLNYQEGIKKIRKLKIKELE